MVLRFGGQLLRDMCQNNDQTHMSGAETTSFYSLSAWQTATVGWHVLANCPNYNRLAHFRVQIDCFSETVVKQLCLYIRKGSNARKHPAHVWGGRRSENTFYGLSRPFFQLARNPGLPSPPWARGVALGDESDANVFGRSHLERHVSGTAASHAHGMCFACPVRCFSSSIE